MTVLTAEKAEARYEAALSSIRNGKPGDNGAEVAYREAYKTLVRMGRRPALRQKYQG